MTDGTGHHTDVDVSHLDGLVASTRRQVDAPLAPQRLELVARFASALDYAAGSDPNVRALAFWLRPARLDVMAQRLTTTRDVVRQPRGLVTQWTPANVESLYAYTWAISFLMGNGTIIRRSRLAQGSTAETLDACLHLAHAASPSLAQATLMVTDDDRSSSEPLSRHADVRMLFGADTSVADLRALPTSPGCIDLPFPARISIAVLSSRAVAALPSARVDRLARATMTDVTTLDGAACSSPRAMVWLGDEETTNVARTGLESALRRLGTRSAEPQQVTSSLTSLYEQIAVLEPGVTVTFAGPVTTIAIGEAPERPLTLVARSGVLVEWRAADVPSLCRTIDGQVQTVASFGLDADQLDQLISGSRRGGVQRIVPVGSATAFDDIWDGIDLPLVLTRTVRVQSRPTPG